MDEFKKLELRMSELRTSLNESFQLTEPTAEQLEQRTKDQQEYQEAEKRYQEYLRGQISEEEKRAEEEKPEVKEFRQLESKVSLGRYMQYAIEGRAQPEGVEKEFSDALKITGMSVPMEAFAPREARQQENGVEKRQDASTSVAANAAVPLMGHPTLGRIFAYSDIEFLALTQVMAGVGEQTFPVLTGGVTPAYAAPGAAKDAEAGTFRFDELAPLGYAARYVFRREDAARLPGIEETLRRDLSMAMADKLSDQVVNGAANPVGFRPNVPTANNSERIGAGETIAALTLNDFLNAVHVFPDGRVSSTIAEVSVLLPQLVNRKINSTLDSSDRPHVMSELLAQFGGYKVSGHLKKDGNNRVGMMVISKGMWTPGRSVLVMWPSVDLIYDPYTKAEKREVALTVSTLWNFKVIDKEPWKNYYVQVAGTD